MFHTAWNDQPVIHVTRTIFTCSVIFLVFLFFPLLNAAAQQTAERPNILLIMADDQGWGDTGYNGHPHLKTPNLDEMAKSGLRFDRFYAAHPVCSPTRASVLTGRHPNRSGCLSWGHTIRPQEKTIAEALKSVGYKTAHFGKWHVGSVHPGSPVNPSASGFDYWLSAPNFYDNNPMLSRRGEAVHVEGESSMILADEAISFMRRQVESDNRFLSVVWFGSPHRPHRAAERDKQVYPEELDNRDWIGEITGIDRAVGKLRSKLREMGIAENTLVWYTSDNGGLKSESTGGRNKKGAIYEGGLRVPAIIEWPAKIELARSTSVPAVTSDIYPTLLDIANISFEEQPPLDGESLVPLIEGEMSERAEPIGFWKYPSEGHGMLSRKLLKRLRKEQKSGNWTGRIKRLRFEAAELSKTYPTDEYPGHAAWLDWPWKLHRRASKNGKVNLELYNLVEDPDESSNVLDEHPDRVDQMTSELEEWQTSVLNSLNGKDY